MVQIENLLSFHRLHVTFGPLSSVILLSILLSAGIALKEETRFQVMQKNR